jgi:hypothetical protein
MTIKGSCLCGAVEYTIAGTPLLLENCHCSMCRKAHGSAYATFAKVGRADFSYTKGADAVVAYQSSPEVTRSFCRQCGAKFTFDWPSAAPDHLWVAAGTFDDDPGMKPECHIFVNSKADWFEIADSLPQHATYPPAHD